MTSAQEEYARGAWEFAWAYTGRSDAAAACLARAFRELERRAPPDREPARRRAVWQALVEACRQQVSARPPGAAESSDPRLSLILDLPLELREALLLARYQGASAEDLGEALRCDAETALGRAHRALSRLLLLRTMPRP